MDHNERGVDQATLVTIVSQSLMQLSIHPGLNFAASGLSRREFGMYVLAALHTRDRYHDIRMNEDLLNQIQESFFSLLSQQEIFVVDPHHDLVEDLLLQETKIDRKDQRTLLGFQWDSTGAPCNERWYDERCDAIRKWLCEEGYILTVFPDKSGPRLQLYRLKKSDDPDRLIALLQRFARIYGISRIEQDSQLDWVPRGTLLLSVHTNPFSDHG